MTKRWYVVHAYSGFEKSVQRALIERITRAAMQDKFGQVLVPVEDVIEMKNGQKSISERKFFPGYGLVEMDMDDDSWHLVVDDEIIVTQRWTVRKGDELDGRTVGELAEARSIGVLERSTPAGDRRFFPGPSTKLTAGDELVVQGTLATLLSSAS